MPGPSSALRFGVGTLLLAALFVTCGSALHAQSLPIGAGDRVRVTSPAYSGPGVVVSVDADTLVLRTDGTQQRQLALSSIRSVHRSVGAIPAGTAFKRGAVAGGIGGAVGGALLGALVCGDPDPCNDGDRLRVVLVGAGVLGAAGAVTGGVTYLLYSQVAGEQWTRVPIPRTSVGVLPAASPALVVRVSL